MYANQYEEHLASQPDNSRWDGFDRGCDFYDDVFVMTVVASAVAPSGREISLWSGEDLWEVRVNGKSAACEIDEQIARSRARAEWRKT